MTLKMILKIYEEQVRLSLQGDWHVPRSIFRDQKGATKVFVAYSWLLLYFLQPFKTVKTILMGHTETGLNLDLGQRTWFPNPRCKR